MCGRFTLRTPANDWCQLFLPDLDPESLPQPVVDDPPRYNIAPTQGIACVLREETGGQATASKMRWGLVPAWADDLKIGNRMINARGETVDSKPSFKKAFAQRRCLIIADGYYEWKKTTDGKQPFLIEQPGSAPMALAGLWEENRRVTDDGSSIRSCTIITTTANPTTKSIHDRMPVILHSQDYASWIDPGYRDTGILKSLLVPLADDRLRLTPVSTHVNSPRNDDPRCVAPI
jgi:putative SOS response-associated peptidase YedK